MEALARRVLVIVVVLTLAAICTHILWRGALHRFGGDRRYSPEDAAWVLPKNARALIAAAFGDKHDHPVLDGRVGVISRGQLSAEDFHNDSREPDIGFFRHPLVWARQRLLDSAAGITTTDQADAEYASQLLRQIHAMPAPYRAKVYARDGIYDSHGRPVHDALEPVVSNRYVDWLATQMPSSKPKASKVLVPVVSIHPQRADATKAIKHWAKAGVTDMVWRPLAQHIDLAGAAARAAYKVMAKAHMTLHVPLGARRTADGREGWIGPAGIKPALKAGVSVQVSLAGANGPDGQRLMPALFALLRDSSYARQLTVDTGGLLAGNAARSKLLALLQHPQFFSRLRYASGYPAAATTYRVNLDRLAESGFVDRADVAPLRAIAQVNPLLFLFCTLRRVHLPATELRLPASVFFAKTGS